MDRLVTTNKRKSARSTAFEAALVAVGNMRAHDSTPWCCVPQDGRMSIDAFVESRGNWQMIAYVPFVESSTSKAAAKANAAFIVRAVNDYEGNQVLIQELTAALELCLECEGELTWAAEHDGEIVMARAKKYLQATETSRRGGFDGR